MNGRTLPGRLRRALLLVPFLAPWPSAAAATLELAQEGTATAVIVLARDPLPSEVTAAEELALYLERVTSASFEVRVEGSRAPRGPRIHVGPTELARREVGDPERLGPEEWVLRTVGSDLVVVGGRPRGTLYAVYHLLEDHVGVRWWSPFEEHVPLRPTLALPRIDESGSPVFSYRDVFGIPGPRSFCARNRLNGHFTRLPWTFGGAESYGPPKHVHNFFDYVPPDVYFDEHPEFFSELGGFRYADETQLCLTDVGLLALVTEKMAGYIERARAQATLEGVPPPRLFDFSPNDWGGACNCRACRAVSEAAGSDAGPLVAFVGRLADAIGETHPDVLLDTLAYLHTFAPPRGPRLPDNVVVRLAALQHRDYTRPVTAPEHRRIREAIEGWARIAPHLRIWDYVVTYGEDGQLPLPNLRVLARDYRYYLEQGIEGMFVQHDFPIAADLRDLKQWVVIKLLEDPRRDVDALIRQFTDGYYGAAGRPIRRYLRRMERAARRDGSRVGFVSTQDEYGYLTPRTVVRGHRLFDRAERRVSGEPELLRRVRHARLSLDRATLLGWDGLRRQAGTSDAGEGLPDRRSVVERYRQTWLEQIELRLPPGRREAARREVDLELRDWGARGP